MEIEAELLRDALRKVLDVEHAHIYGAKTGSETARRREVDAALGRAIDDLVARIPVANAE